MKRIPTEWLQFAVANEREDDPVCMYPKDAPVMCSFEAFAHFAEAVRREALQDAIETIDDIDDNTGGTLEAGLCKAMIMIEKMRDEAGR